MGSPKIGDWAFVTIGGQEYRGRISVVSGAGISTFLTHAPPGVTRLFGPIPEEHFVKMARRDRNR